MELEAARDDLMNEVYKVKSDRKDFDLNVSIDFKTHFKLFLVVGNLFFGCQSIGQRIEQKTVDDLFKNTGSCSRRCRVKTTCFSAAYY